jgi:hypothetical protein
MEIATLNQLKKELKSLSHDDILLLCLRLGRFKKENKELMQYLLMDAHDEEGYITQVKQDIAEGIADININNMHFAKKGIRKVLKMVIKQIRFSGIKKTEVELLIFYCQQVLEMGIPLSQSRVVVNVLNTQLKKILKAKATLHEDLQYDYKEDITKLIDQLSYLEAKSMNYGY